MITERIVLVVSSFPKLSETFIVNKFIRLLERNLDMHIVCQNKDHSQLMYFPQLTNVKKRIHIIWPHRPRWLAILFFPLCFIRSLFLNPYGFFRYIYRGWRLFGIDILRRFYLDSEIIILKPDIVHFEFGALAVKRTRIKELLNSKIIVSFRGYDIDFHNIDIPHYYDSVWKEADIIHSLGEYIWKRCKERGCPPEKEHILIPPAIDTNFFNPDGRIDAKAKKGPKDAIDILSVGRLYWKKGYEYALQAIGLLLKEGLNLKYRIVGDGEFFKAIAFVRHQLGLEKTVTLLGNLPPDKVREEMEKADIFLHAAVEEGFSNAVLEAQTMGLPVVCTDAGGLPENVIDGETGFIVERRNPKALAEKINILAKDLHLREKMGKAARKRVENKFSLPSQIDAFLNMYKSLSA